MRREASSGRRLDDPEATKVRVINRIGGMRLWNAHLRVSRSAGHPVVEIRQRPWTRLFIPVFYVGLAASVLIGEEETASRKIAAVILVFIVALAVGIYAGSRAWVRAGPDGLTIRPAMRRRPQTIPWSEINEVHVTTEGGSREYVTSISVMTSGSNPMARPMKLLRPLSVRRSHLLGLVLLATSHRYGARGLYLGEQGGWGWKGRGNRALVRDERYFRSRGSPPAAGVRSDQP